VPGVQDEEERATVFALYCSALSSYPSPKKLYKYTHIYTRIHTYGVVHGRRVATLDAKRGRKGLREQQY
jgi:hypothetical protein